MQFLLIVVCKNNVMTYCNVIMLTLTQFSRKFVVRRTGYLVYYGQFVATVLFSSKSELLLEPSPTAPMIFLFLRRSCVRFSFSLVVFI